MAEVLFELKPNGVGVLTLSSPENLNAMDEDMAVVFQKKIHEIKDQDLKVLVLTGAGKAFSAGGNLDMLEKKIEFSPKDNQKKMMDFYQQFLCIRDLGVPLIAAINGHAIGAGLCVALACDIRVISEQAKLGLTFTKLGLHPGMGATYFLPRVVGEAAANELLLTARVIKGVDASKWGISHNIVSKEQVMERALSIAEEITHCGSLATKQLLSSLRGDGEPLQAALRREAECQAENYGSEDFKEGISAIKEKRKPNF